jgi:hypothetical protein
MILKDVMPIGRDTFKAQISKKLENKKFSVLVSLKLLSYREVQRANNLPTIIK